MTRVAELHLNNQVLGAGERTRTRGYTKYKMCCFRSLRLILNIKFESHAVNLGVVLRTGAVWRGAAPLAVQLAHPRRVADDAALADAAVADD